MLLAIGKLLFICCTISLVYVFIFQIATAIYQKCYLNSLNSYCKL